MRRCAPLLALLSILMLTAACGRSTPTRYYLLESALPPIKTDSLPKKSLRVATVTVPDYLDRTGIVSRVDGQTQLIVAEFHAWAEPLVRGVGRVSREVLTAPLLKHGVTVLASAEDSNAEYVLLLDVQRLDGNFNAKAVLELRWTLKNRDDKILGRGIYAAEELVSGADYDILTAAESRLVRNMAAHLATRLPALMGGTS